ncbi:MAG: M20/M25/M40 family metallo-hydrolase, partial [Acidobacteria bacterium]|nr:M20/M25/M40 family metallo-hydrolase [Acidobacteriota bacterium]
MNGFIRHNPIRFALAAATALALSLPLAAQVQERVDLDAVYKIKEEGFQRSRVMEYASWLTDVHGPRLTGSPLARAAADYTVKELQALGLENVKLETWGPFGRGWTNDYLSVHVKTPTPWAVLAFPKAWSPGTNGPVTAEVVKVTLESEADIDKLKGQLKGKFVAVAGLREVKPLFEAPGKRYTDAELTEMKAQPVGPDPFRRRAGGPMANFRQQMEQRRKMAAFLASEGIAGLIEPSPGSRGDSGSVLVGGAGAGEGGRQPNDPAGFPVLVAAAEHYNRIVRLLDKKIPVTLEVNVKNTFHDKDLNSFNIVGEIPGTDKKDEIVLIGAHFDSWHTGTGATDNGASSAVMMEVMRILKATGLQPRRTIRIALWTGEEQGLLGSRAYVKDHLADRETMALKPEHGKFAAYFNMDNGGGQFRGIYLQGNEAAAPIFEAWMKPFQSLGMTTLTIRNTSGTDHLAFDAVGLPGFQFVQDPMEYSTRTHHTNLDVYERLVPEDLMK